MPEDSGDFRGGEMIEQHQQKLRILVATEDNQTLLEVLVSFEMAGRFLGFLGHQLFTEYEVRPAPPMPSIKKETL